MAETSENIFTEDETQAPRACRPFVKWAGGKTFLLGELKRRFPQKFNTYFEPFLGGGAVFFAVQPKQSFLYDINSELVNAYNIVKKSPEDLIAALRQHKYESAHFYKVRDADRLPDYAGWSDVEKAARLIFLNKTCFNGLYRVNSSGFFNVPFGRYTNPLIADAENIRACSAALQEAVIGCGDFSEMASKVQKGDFVYLDPPYAPLNKTSSFTAYSKEGFGDDMQVRLFEFCRELNEKGVQFMLSNSSSPFIGDLYRSFNVEYADVPRFINSKGGSRGSVRELIVRNYV